MIAGLKILSYLKIYPVLLLCGHAWAQVPKIPGVPDIAPPKVHAPQDVTNITGPRTSATPARPSITTPYNPQQNQFDVISREVEQHERLQYQALLDVYEDIDQMEKAVTYELPSWSVKAGSEYYREAFDKIIKLDTLGSVAEKNFLIENAYYGNQLNKQDFESTINDCVKVLLGKMKEKGYSHTSNTAKNFILFQFFTEPMQLNGSKYKHMPFFYDFDDYAGVGDYSKLFVTKLLRTGSGQCHSMPLLYLILAEKIGAEAYLALSPNHSYIRFPDDSGKWYNIELTNGMFSTTSYILQSGYIKSEALQNKIFMQNLSKQELQAHHLTDLAIGYVHKFGYDEFVQQVIDKALKLYPNSINAHMIKANLDTARFEYVMKQLNINPRDPKELQQIRNYPEAIALLNKVNSQYDKIDNLGYEPMPEEAYQNWLQAMKQEEQKREGDKLNRQVQTVITNKKRLD